ncbi:hypothetical protein RHSIM_Rhsim10G0199800 [Rhododendron simsii]|uniref:AMP-dependent synthetase/ligase domain-containing protein n=1 Tax=Rhododendron simsii TaxID=118357 RepID=A0A834L9X8_RHOSS|nr:hypothetical protein RHSIM_Rhsim10G0199800 [Rhododendron simsii]
MEGMVKCSANHAPLSPISFLKRAAFVHGDKVSIVYGDTTYPWRETCGRCIRLASVLSQMGLNCEDVEYLGLTQLFNFAYTIVCIYHCNSRNPHFWLREKVAALAPNIPALYKLYFGVPMAGVVLSAFNTSLDAPINRGAFSSTQEVPPGGLDYDRLLEMGKHDFEIVSPINECDPITVNYTSGSTGMPKGAVYSNRSVYLNLIAQIFLFKMSAKMVFLWTMDMFHCNRWCFIWALAALDGTNIYLRNVTAKAIFDSIFIHKPNRMKSGGGKRLVGGGDGEAPEEIRVGIRDGGVAGWREAREGKGPPAMVTHLCGAPTILNIIAEAPFACHRPLPTKVDLVIAGALPPIEILNNVHKLGFNVSHAIKDRDSVHNVVMEGVDVKDPTTMRSVPADGKTIGEVMLRSNTLMLGYLKNVQGTQVAFKNGCAQKYYLFLTKFPIHKNQRRAVDAIFNCEGDAISTLEIEVVSASDLAVEATDIVGRPDDLLDSPVPGVHHLYSILSLKRISLQRRHNDSVNNKDVNNISTLTTAQGNKHVSRQRAGGPSVDDGERLIYIREELAALNRELQSRRGADNKVMLGAGDGDNSELQKEGDNGAVRWSRSKCNSLGVAS